MRVINISAENPARGPIVLGHRGENDATKVVFDFASWQNYGAGIVSLLVKRYEDANAYPVAVFIEGTEATWTVSNSDTDVVGPGECEWRYTVGGTVVKSAVFPTAVLRDIGPATDTPPDPYESWLEALMALATETEENAGEAEASATAAAGSAAAAAASASDAADSAGTAETARAGAETAEDSAEGSALAAEGWAVGTQDGEAATEGSPYFENNAAFYARLAAQGAEEAGYAWFHVELEDGEAYVTVSDNLAKDVLFAVDVNIGELEVTVL